MILSLKPDEIQAEMFIQGYKKLLAFHHDCFAVAFIATQQCLALLTETKPSTKPHGRGRYLYGIKFFTSTVLHCNLCISCMGSIQNSSHFPASFFLQSLCLQVVCGWGTEEEGS